MEQDFSVVAVGHPYTMFNIGKCKNIDSAVVFEALPDNSGYALNIYMSDMTAQEADIIASAPISVRVLKDTTSLLLPTIRFGNTEILFELIFDPTLYKDNRSLQLVLDNNKVQIVAIDSVTNIVKGLRCASMPKRLRELWVLAWAEAFTIEGFSAKYENWSKDIASRYTLEKLWDMSNYVGKFGDR